MDTAGDVVPEVFGRVCHRFADESVCGEMHDGIRLHIADGAGNGRGIGEIANDQSRPGIDRLAVALGQIIEYGDLVIEIEQLLDTNAANVSGAAGNEDIHYVEGPTEAKSAEKVK